MAPRWRQHEPSWLQHGAPNAKSALSKNSEKPLVFIGFFDPGRAKMAPRSLQNGHAGRSWSQDGAKITPKWSCWTKLEPSGRVGGAKLRPGGFQVEAKWLPGGAAPAKVASKRLRVGQNRPGSNNLGVASLCCFREIRSSLLTSPQSP